MLTYNLHHGEGTDAKLDLQRIADIIKSVAPYYAGLQEIDSVTLRTGKVNQAAEYARLTNMEWDFGRAIPYEGGGYGNTLLCKVAPKKIAKISLPGDEARMAIIADIDISNGQDPANSMVTFIDTHLMNGGPEAEADRLESAKLINAYVQDPAHGDITRPMILLGDMNAVKGAASILEFQKQWQAADFDYGIDWVFFRPANLWQFVRAAKLTTGTAAIASDHHPVEQNMVLLRPTVSISPLSHRQFKPGPISYRTIIQFPQLALGLFFSPEIRHQYMPGGTSLPDSSRKFQIRAP